MLYRAKQSRFADPSAQGGISIAYQNAQDGIGIVHRVREVFWVTWVTTQKKSQR